MVVLDTLGPA
jgi:hypothetical protein